MGKKSWKSWKEDKKRSKVSNLSNWKKDGEVTVWLHTNSGMYQKGKHTIPYVGTDDNKDPKLRFFNFNCHEDADEFLRYKTASAQYCPLDLFVEWLDAQDQIEDNDVVWECIVGDKTDRMLSKYDVINNWQTKFSAKMKSVIPVINDADPSTVCVTEEPMSIEIGIFKAIEDLEKKLTRSNKDPEFADPDTNPYPFLWEFNSKAKKADEYYNVIALNENEPSKQIKDLLDGEEVDLSGYIAPGNTKMLRKIMEDHIVIDGVPFDELFANVKDANTSTDFNYGNNVSEETPKKVRKVKKVKEEPEPVVESKPGDEYEEVYSCDACGKNLPPGSEDLEVCPFCG